MCTYILIYTDTNKYQIFTLSKGEWTRHCNAEDMKHVFPRLTNPQAVVAALIPMIV
jgi:hypothetical protein